MSVVGAINVEITLLHCLLFGSLISAVDPVAVSKISLVQSVTKLFEF